MKVKFESAKRESPDVEKGLKVPYAPAKRAFPRWRWYLVVLLVSSPLFFFVVKLALGWLLASSPAMLSLEKVDLNSPRPAVVQEIGVREGDRVVAGTLLVRLEDAALEGKVEMLETERTVLERSGPAAAPPLAPLEEALVLAREAAARRAEYLQTVRELFSQGAATRAELNLAIAQDQEARADLIRARADLGTTALPEDDSQKQTRLAQIRSELAFLEKGKNALEVVSPCDARVLQLFARQGQAVAQGGELLVLADPVRSSITAFVEARHLRYARPGRMVKVRFPGNRIMEAEVQERPYRALPLPSELSRPLEETRQSISVNLVLSGDIPAEFLVDGLPLTVFWGGVALPW